MKTSSPAGATNAFATLRRLAQPRREVEECEFCNAVVLPGHRHLFEPATRKIICACDPCALRFENVVGRWKLIPRDPRPLSSFKISEADWAALALPIELVFIFYSSAANRAVAMYPSPAGATESLLPLSSWEALISANVCLSELAPDVEALLINRLGQPPEYYIAPIDLCFELVGLIRIHWRGLAGGDVVWQKLQNFFTHLKARVADHQGESKETCDA